MRQIRIRQPGVRHERLWPEVLPPGPRDPGVVRAQELAQAGTQLPDGRAADCSTSLGITQVIRRNAY